MSEPILMQSRNIYDQQAHNRRMTWLVMLMIVVFFAFIGLGFDYFYFGFFVEQFDIPIATIVVTIASIIFAFVSLNDGASMVLRSAQATPAVPTNPQHRQLLNVVQEMSLASGLPAPRVYVIPDEDPNAFATGKDPRNSVIVVTQGLLDSLDREELQGVVAHEMSHIRYYDIRFMTIVAAMVGTIVLLSDLALRGLRFGLISGRGGGRSKSKNSLGGVIFIVWIIAIIFAPIITRMMAMLISRKREYLADASAAELTRNPIALAKALQKLENASAPTATIKRGIAHLCVVDPLGKKVNEKEGFWSELFSTHPPMKKRIMLLKSMAYTGG